MKIKIPITVLLFCSSVYTHAQSAPPGTYTFVPVFQQGSSLPPTATLIVEQGDLAPGSTFSYAQSPQVTFDLAGLPFTWSADAFTLGDPFGLSDTTGHYLLRLRSIVNQDWDAYPNPASPPPPNPADPCNCGHEASGNGYWSYPAAPDQPFTLALLLISLGAMGVIGVVAARE